MAKEKVNVAEKGLNVDPVEQVQQNTSTPQTTQVVPQEAMTYQEDANGNIVAGNEVGVMPGTNLNTEESLIAQVNEPQTEQPQTTEVKAKTYTLPWDQDGYTADKAMKDNPNMPVKDIMDDQIKWANETGGKFDVLSFCRTPDIYKSMAQNEADEKKAANQEKWERLGNFLSHLGNFVGTAGFGAPSQNIESATALTERQKKMRDSQLAVRREQNKNYFDQYWKERADQQAQQRMDIDKRKQDRLDEDQRLRIRKQDWYEKYQQGILDAKAEERRINEEYKRGVITEKQRANDIAELKATVAQMNAVTARQNANTREAGYTTEVTEENGVKKTVRTVGTGGTSGSGTDNTSKYAQYKTTNTTDYSQYKRKKQ